MPKKRKPAYSLHKGSGQARVRINGRDLYLGEHDTPESFERYEELVAEWIRENGDVAGLVLTVDELALVFVDHADGYYVKDGKPTCEVNNIRIALRPVIRLFGNIRARDFSPKKLNAVRVAMIEAGCVRTSINRQVGRIKRMFRWAVENEYVPADVYSALATVAGLRAGRSVATESDPVKPVPAAFVEAVETHVTRQIWGMVQVQQLTGMRPGEVSAIRVGSKNSAELKVPHFTRFTACYCSVRLWSWGS